MGNLECPFLSTETGIDVLPFLSGSAPPGSPTCCFNETNDNQAQENQSIALSCRRDPEVNQQNANFRNLINGDELARTNKLLLVEEPAVHVLSCRNTELQLLKLQILSSREALAGRTALSGVAPGSPL